MLQRVATRKLVVAVDASRGLGAYALAYQCENGNPGVSFHRTYRSALRRLLSTLDGPMAPTRTTIAAWTRRGALASHNRRESWTDEFA
jgi:hypothetical protein